MGLADWIDSIPAAQPEQQQQAAPQQQPTGGGGLADWIDSIPAATPGGGRPSPAPATAFQPQASPDLASLVSLPARPIEAPPQETDPVALAAQGQFPPDEAGREQLRRELVRRATGGMTHSVGEEVRAVGTAIGGGFERLGGGLASLFGGDKEDEPGSLDFGENEPGEVQEPDNRPAFNQQLSDELRQDANARMAANPVQSRIGKIAAAAPITAGMLAAGVAGGPAGAIGLWGLTGAAEMHNRAMDALEPAVRRGEMSAADAHQTAIAESVWGGFAGAVTAAIPAFGKVAPTFLQGLLRTAMAGGANSVANDLIARGYHGDPKTTGEVVEDALLQATVAGVLHGLFHIFDTAPGDVRAAASAVAPESVVDIAGQRWAAYRAGKMTREEALRPENMSAADVRQIFNYFRRQEGAQGSQPAAGPPPPPPQEGATFPQEGATAAQTPYSSPQAAPQAPPDATGATGPTQPGPLPVPQEAAPPFEPAANPPMVAPAQPTAPPLTDGAAPSWLTENMQQQGITPGRVFNDVEMARGKMPDLIRKDPITRWVAENQPELLDRAMRGDLTPQEIRQIADQIKKGPSNASPPPRNLQPNAGNGQPPAGGNGPAPAPANPQQPPAGPVAAGPPDAGQRPAQEGPVPQAPAVAQGTVITPRDSATIFKDGKLLNATVTTREREGGGYDVLRVKLTDPQTGMYEPAEVPPGAMQGYPSSRQAREAVFRFLEEQYPPPKAIEAQPNALPPGPDLSLLDKRMDLRDGQPKLTVRDSMMDAGSRGWDYPTWARNFKHTAATLGDNGPRLWDARGQGAGSYTPPVAQGSGAGPANTPSQPPAGPTGDNARWKAKPGGFGALLDKLPRADLQQLLAENGLELTDSDNVVFRDKRGGGGVTRMTKGEFVDWVLGNHPNDDPATYGPDDPQWMDLLNRARAIAGTKSSEQAAPAPTGGTGAPNAVQEPGPGTVLQRPPGEAGVAGGGRGRVEPGQQGAQAPVPVGPVEAQPVRQAGGDRGTQAPKPVAKAPPKPFTKADLEQTLLAHHELAKDANYTAADEAALTKASSSGRAWTFLGKKLPGEVTRYIEDNPTAKKLFSLTDDPTQAGGEDAMQNMGDRYWQVADKITGTAKKKMLADALATAEQSPDPQVQLAAAVYKNLPKGRARPSQQLVDPKTLPPGTEFELNGHQMRIIEDADGYRVLRDGDDYPVLPVDGLERVPVDKGTMHQAEPELPEGDVFPAETQPKPAFFDADEAGVSKTGKGLFGQTTADAATGNQQGAMFDTSKPQPASEPIRGSREALNPKNTGEMFPPRREGEVNADIGRGGGSGFRKPPGNPPAPPAAPGQPPPGPAPTPAHLKSALYGPGSFVADVLAPKTKAIVGGLTEFVSQVRKAVAPQTRGQDAAKVARALREMMARRAVGDNRTLEVFKKASALFDGMSREASIEFWDNAERGKDQGDPALNMIAKQLVAAENALGQEVRRVAPGKLRQMITDKEYLGRIWKDPKKAGDVLAGILGKRPLEGRKGFLKQRSLDWFTDGIKAGLEPVTYNPVDMGLLKMAEMRRFIEMHRALNELKVNGLRKYVGINEDAPKGWETVDDAAFTVYGPPTVTASEGYDKGVREPLLRLAEKLGVKHVRKLALGGGKRGLSYTGQNKIETKYGTMDQVIAHELGHQIGDRWNLLHRLSKAPEPGIRTKRGQQKHRAKIAEQWRRLADLRHELTPDAPDYYKDYVRKGEEKEAVLLQAWVQARDKFRDVAPDLYRRWVDFLNKTPELHALLHIEPSLDMGEDDYEIPHGGLLTMGNYYVPAEAAQLFRNILTPGLRQRSGLVRAWFAVNNVMNQTSLGISAFHAMGSAINAGISDVALALTRLARGEPLKAVMPLVRGATVGGSVAKYLYTGGKMLREWYKPGTTGGDVAELVKAAVMGGARAELSSAYRTDAMAGFRKALRQIKAEEGTAKLNPLAKALVKAPWAAVELTAWPIMQGLVPRIKFGAFAELARREMERLGPDADKDELRKAFARAWDSIDNRFGQLVHDNAFWDPIVRDLAMGSVRSVGWNLGDVREIAGGMADLVGETAKAATGHKPELTDRTAFAFALPILVGALGAALMYALTGKKPKDLKDYYYPQTGELDGEGRPVRLSMPTYMKDVFGMVQHPLDTLKHKAAPLLSAVADVIENKDYHGVQVREGAAGQQAKQSVEHVVKSGMPFSVQQWQKMTEQGVPLAKRLMAATGFAQAPASVNDTPAEAKAKEITRAKAAVGGRTQKEADHANLKYKLVEAVKKDGEAGRKQVVKAAQARQISDREEVDILKRESQMSGLAYRVKHMALSDAMEIWKLANEKERKELRPIMVEKIAYSQDPDLDRPAKRKMIQSLGATTQPTTLPASMSE